MAGEDTRFRIIDCPRCGHKTSGHQPHCLYCGELLKDAPGAFKPAARAAIGLEKEPRPPPAAKAPRPARATDPFPESPRDESGPAGLTCPQCHHAVAARMARCIYCGSVLSPPKDQTHRRCPRCDVGLDLTVATWVAIDRCGTCGGEFYDPGELDRVNRIDDRGKNWLAQHLWPHRHDSKEGTSLKCPGCGSGMDTLRVPVKNEFLIDLCTKCRGIWLDKGEPEKLREAVKEGTLFGKEPDSVGSLFPARDGLHLEDWDEMVSGAADLARVLFDD